MPINSACVVFVRKVSGKSVGVANGWEKSSRLISKYLLVAVLAPVLVLDKTGVTLWT